MPQVMRVCQLIGADGESCLDSEQFSELLTRLGVYYMFG